MKTPFLNILFLEWNSYGNRDMLEAFYGLSAEVVRYPFDKNTERRDADFERRFREDLLRISPDFVFSFNYFPIVSLVCNEAGIPYAAWVYDNPHVALYSYTLINPCNYVFLFDSSQCEEFAQAGIPTVHYLPLAASPRRLGSLFPDEPSLRTYAAPASFVGSLYTEPKHQLYERLEPGLSDYTRGFLEGLMECQSRVYGCSFLQHCLPESIVQDLLSAYPMLPNSDGVETSEYLYAQYVLARRLTSLERRRLLSMLAEVCPVKLYTPDPTVRLPGVENMGPVDYYDAMPFVFQRSKINLNITLRSIGDGIPLRAFDIMGSGGFLLSNYQSDFLRFFRPGEELVLFDTPEDMLAKAEYFLSHDKERREIAENGRQAILRSHTYEHRLEQMLDVMGLR